MGKVGFRLLFVLCAALAGISHTSAQDIMIELTPGLYEFSETKWYSHHGDTEIYEQCKSVNSETKVSVKEKLNTHFSADCEVSNMSQTKDNATANFICRDLKTGRPILGDLTVSYGLDYYSASLSYNFFRSIMGEKQRFEVFAYNAGPCS